jgi:Zn-finger nucleic acid-binding protein
VGVVINRDEPRQPGDDLDCPRCGGRMRTHLRNSVAIDQCDDCHGIFLDPGELERLMSAEQSILGRR